MFLILISFVSQVIAEGANGPTTPDAEKILIANKKLVIPVCILTFDRASVLPSSKS